MSVAKLNISGAIAHGETTETVTYFVVDKTTGTVVGAINLPNMATFASGFSLNVDVPRATGAYDVGTFDDKGAFVSAGFKVSLPDATGAVG